jgi:hypothetical protein
MGEERMKITLSDPKGDRKGPRRSTPLPPPLLCMSGQGSPTIPACGCTARIGEGVKPFFSYLFFFTCIRGTGRDLMGRFFCPG